MVSMPIKMLIGLLASSQGPHFAICLLGMATRAKHLQIGWIITARKFLRDYVIHMGLFGIAAQPATGPALEGVPDQDFPPHQVPLLAIPHLVG